MFPYSTHDIQQQLTNYKTSFDYCYARIMNADAPESTYPDDEYFPSRRCLLCDREYVTSARFAATDGGLCIACGDAYVKSQEEEEGDGGFLSPTNEDAVPHLPRLPDTSCYRPATPPGQVAKPERMGKFYNTNLRVAHALDKVYNTYVTKRGRYDSWQK